MSQHPPLTSVSTAVCPNAPQGAEAVPPSLGQAVLITTVIGTFVFVLLMLALGYPPPDALSTAGWCLGIAFSACAAASVVRKTAKKFAAGFAAGLKATVN